MCQDIVCDPKLSFIFISFHIDYSSSHSDRRTRSIAPVFHPSCIHTVCHITLQCSPTLREMFRLTPWLVQPCQQAEQCELHRGLEKYLNVLVCSVACLWLPLTHAWLSRSAPVVISPSHPSQDYPRSANSQLIPGGQISPAQNQRMAKPMPDSIAKFQTCKQNGWFRVIMQNTPLLRQ